MGLPRPSHWALERASQLGAAMARAERRIAPAVDAAGDYVSYVQFLHAHRQRLEHLPCFVPWESHLQRLIDGEREARSIEPTKRREWDDFDAGIAEPMRCSFWYGWETAVNLYELFQRQTRLVAQGVQRGQIPEVAEGAFSRSGYTSPEQLDDDVQWDLLSADIFGILREHEPAAPVPQPVDATH